MTETTFESRFRVRSYELDALGHVNHAVFLNYLEQARIEALERAGIGWNAMLERGWLFNVVHIEIDYRRDARMGDTLRVSTAVDAFGDTSMTVVQRVWKDDDDDGAAVAEARVVGVLVGRDGRPMRVPDEMRSKLG